MHADTNTEQPGKRARVDDIVTLAARIWRQSREDITGKSRQKIHVRPRQAVYLIAREHGHSLPHIARRCGDRDHSSVIHGIAQAENMVERLPIYAEMLCQLRREALHAEAFIFDRERQLDMQLQFRAPVESVRRAAAKIKTKELIAKPAKKPRNVFDNRDFTRDALADVSIELSNTAFVDALLKELAGIAKRHSGRVMIG